ncbi:hypothetical protein ACFQYP_26870 [Nonomuraea antimicrobica]
MTIRRLFASVLSAVLAGGTVAVVLTQTPPATAERRGDTLS